MPTEESQKFTADVERLKTESAEIIALVTKSQTDLVAANAEIARLIEAGASDAELAAAARTAQPEIVQVVTDLDALTPAGTPVVEGMRASSGRRR